MDIIISDTSFQKEKPIEDSVSKLDRINNTIEKYVKYFPIPMVSYSSETNWLFGLSKLNSFRMGTKDQNDKSIQPSQITGLVYLTLNKQYKGVITSDLIFGDNKYEIFTQIKFIDFPN